MENCLLPSCVEEGEISVVLSNQRYYEEKEEPGMCFECNTIRNNWKRNSVSNRFKQIVKCRE